MSNIFKNSSRLTNKEKKKTEKENINIDLSLESFPSLGGVKENSNLSISFSNALNQEQKKKKKKKNDLAGFLVIKKNGEKYQHEDSERFVSVKNTIDEMNKMRRWYRFVELEAEREYDEQINILLNGPDYINSWEVSNYLEMFAKEEYKRKKEENNIYENDDIDEYSE